MPFEGWPINLLLKGLDKIGTPGVSELLQARGVKDVTHLKHVITENPQFQKDVQKHAQNLTNVLLANGTPEQVDQAANDAVAELGVTATNELMSAYRQIRNQHLADMATEAAKVALEEEREGRKGIADQKIRHQDKMFNESFNTITFMKPGAPGETAERVSIAGNDLQRIRHYEKSGWFKTTSAQIQGSVTDVGGFTPTPAVFTEVQTDLITARDSLETLGALGRSFNDKYATLPGKLQAKFANAKSLVGMDLTPSEQEAAQNLMAHQALQLQNLQRVLKALSGTQVSDKEFERIIQSMPDPSDSPLAFRASLNATIMETQWMIMRKQTILDEKHMNPIGNTRILHAKQLQVEFETALPIAMELANAEARKQGRAQASAEEGLAVVLQVENDVMRKYGLLEGTYQSMQQSLRKQTSGGSVETDALGVPINQGQ